MKFLAILLGSLACASFSNAQYYSEGWTPGMPVPTGEATPHSTWQGYRAAPTKTGSVIPTSLKELQDMFDLTNLLTSGPVADLAAKAGYNITEKLAEVKSRKIWDERVPLITDENYEDLVVNEAVTADEEDKRVWFIVM